MGVKSPKLFSENTHSVPAVLQTRNVRGGAFSSGAGRGGFGAKMKIRGAGWGGAKMKIRGAVRGGAGQKSA